MASEQFLNRVAGELTDGIDPETHERTVDELRREALAREIVQMAELAGGQLSEIEGFKTSLLIEVRCGVCGDGEQFAPDGIGYSVAPDEAHAISIIADAGGAVFNDVAYCSGCLEDAAESARESGETQLARQLDAAGGSQGRLAHGSESARVIPIEAGRKS